MADVHGLEYERRMRRVLAHIDAHLSEPLDLPRLADVAHFSPFHFHRLFAAWMGDGRRGLSVDRRRQRPLVQRHLACGRYAVLPFRGNMAEVELAWTRLLRDWLPSSGLQLDGRPVYEHYQPGVTGDATMGVFACDICIPVAAL